MTDENKLLPCPFCGGEAILMTPAGSRPYVMCATHFCAGPQNSTEIAIAAWNSRAVARDLIPALLKERDALAKVRAEEMREVVGCLKEDNILSAAERTGYEPYEDRIAAQDRVAADAVKSFVGAKDEAEALKMALRHAEDRIAAARNRIIGVKRLLERHANKIEKGDA